MSLLTSVTRTWLTRSFRPFRFTDEHDTLLAYTDSKNTGLYVHIPFCRSLCAFCPYCKTVFEQELAARYVNALLQEIDMIGAMAGGIQTNVSSLYFGGGSPALLAHDIHRIIARLQRYFIITEGIGVELHPQDVTEQTLIALQQAGITKISIGVQSFQDVYLDLLGRQHIDFAKMFRELSKVSLEQYYGLELWVLQRLGWIQKVDTDYVMTTKGSYYYHYFEHFYTLSYIDQMWNVMRNDAFPEQLVIH